MNHPDLDILTADANDLSSAEEREQVHLHLDACPACLDLYSQVCVERALIETARPRTGPWRSVGAAVAVLLVASVAWVGADLLKAGRVSPQESLCKLSSPATRAQAASDLLRMGPAALAVLERGAKEDNEAVSRASQDLIHMIGGESPLPTNTLVDAVAQWWTLIKEEAGKGNRYADKKDFQLAYQEWKEAHRPDPAAMAEAEKAVLGWFESRKAEKGLEWRIRRLLSELARDRKDLKNAADELDRAIASYPYTRYSQPSKHSKFQHLVNDRAMMIWDDQGLEAAIVYATDLIVKDKRLYYFFSWPWEQRFEKSKDEEGLWKFGQRIRAAVVSRPVTFSEPMDESESK